MKARGAGDGVGILQLRRRAWPLVVACTRAVLLYVASLNLLEVLEAVARARALGA